jgi:hypothetical protein
VMVWRYAVADQPERHWKPVNDCDLYRDIGLLAEGLRGVDPCWPGPHNGNDERCRLGGRRIVDQLDTTGSICGSDASCS